MRHVDPYFIEPKCIVCDLIARDRYDIYRALAYYVSDTVGDLDKQTLIETISNQYSPNWYTGNGVLMPHLSMSNIDIIHSIFIKIEHPIELNAPDGQPIQFIYMLLTPEKLSTRDTLRYIAATARVIRDRNITQEIQNASDENTLRQILSHRDTQQKTAAA